MDLNKSPYQDQKLQHNNDKTKRPGYPCIRISVNQCMVKKDPPVISDPRFSLAARSGGNRLKRIFLFKSILGQWTKKDLFIQIDSKTMCIAVTGSGGGGASSVAAAACLGVHCAEAATKMVPFRTTDSK